MKRFFPYPWYLNMWFSWVVATGVYTILILNGALTLERYGGTFFARSAGLIGLFVPIGAFNLEFSLVRGVWWIIFPLVAVAVLVSDAIAGKYKIDPTMKIAINLGLLLIATLCVDLIIWQQWVSWRIFVDGGMTVHPLIP